MKELTITRINLDTIDSTQSEMRRVWKTLPRDQITILVAKEQSQGIGRLKDRRWLSPRGNFYVTLTLFLDATRSDLAHLGQVTALALREAILSQGLSHASVRLKWPNDLLIDQKKVGGVLVETFRDSSYQACLIGMGLNLSVTPDLTAERLQPTTNLLQELQKHNLPSLAYEQAVDLCLQTLVNSLSRFVKEGFAPFLYPYATALIHNKGDLLTTSQHNKKIEGLFLGIDPSGALILEVEGKRQLFVCGEWR